MTGDLISFILVNFQLFILILVRVTGLFVISPIFGRNNLPTIMKIGLSITVALILLPLKINGFYLEIDNMRTLMFWSISEFLIGIIIGLIAFIYFSIVYLAGTIVDIQMGFGMVNIMDPQTNAQMPLMGGFYNILLTLVFLTINGHHQMIKSLIYSYEILPIGFNISVSESLINYLIKIFTDTFILAFQLSAPILIAIFLANVILGILARTMPQMNIFIVGLPLKIAIGIIIILLSLRFFIPYSESLFDKMFQSIYELMQILSRG
ncbi:flagellar type III secretion system protein FliR [Alkaliphilus sp. MSJ-5]|uniref:Flagellar biosynthetic protein FliR n=1 Tax=Alkaliphilus flagellatus TaxID=2841507 RepID=A0ABS6G7Q4_9FIRM|nr:flagellar biosynthetic protein FliR [Alkaliphilus flagellatus]MBU5677431.1 flagellar type III secretion system protein FliR [Alkaliphilus flagellatus]